MTDVSTLATAKDAAVICASIVGIYVALSGLKTWKRQVIGTDQIKTIRNAISCLLVYGENIKRVRDLNSTIAEIPNPSKEDREKYTGQQSYYVGLSAAFDSRLRDLNESRAELESALIEVEAVSRPVLETTKETLFGHEDELRTAVTAFKSWNNPDLPQMLVTAAWNVLEPRFRTVAPDDPNNDEFAKGVNLAVTNMINELRYKQKLAG
jgi:hypothetical protein